MLNAARLGCGTCRLADHALGERAHLGHEPPPAETEEHGILYQPRTRAGFEDRHQRDCSDFGLDARAAGGAVRADCPGKQNNLTVKITLKPRNVNPGATADLGVSCFSNMGVHLIYKAR